MGQTGVALGIEVDDKMPQHEYYEYFGPDYTLHVAPSNMENKNSHQILDEIRAKLLDNLSKLRHAPSVQFQERPPDTELPEVCFYRYHFVNMYSFLLQSSSPQFHFNKYKKYIFFYIVEFEIMILF